MGAPENNQNAAKPDAEKLEARVWVNVTQEEKTACVRAANLKGEKLTEWARAVLTEQATKENMEQL